MDLEAGTFVINIGLLIATAGGTAIAWWGAIAAGRRRTEAGTARDEAVKAQQQAVAALDEANRIAADARDIAADARDVMQAQDARSIERHSVKWQPYWDWETAKWTLGNHGPDTAHEVRVSVESPSIERQTVDDDEVPANFGLSVQFPAFHVNGASPRVHWRVDWRTPLGNTGHDQGVWPE